MEFAASTSIRNAHSVWLIVIFIDESPLKSGLRRYDRSTPPDALFLHVAGNHYTLVGAHKLHLSAGVNNHEVAVNDAVCAGVHCEIAGAVGVHRIGAGESNGRDEASEIRGGSARDVSVTVEKEIHGFCEGHKSLDLDVIRITGNVDQAGGAGSVSALQDRSRASLGIRMQFECLASGKSCQAGNHE